MRWMIDPRYEEEVSGCTACVGLINDEKIYIVRSHLLRSSRCNNNNS